MVITRQVLAKQLSEMTIGTIESRTALRLIREWAVLHQAELLANWEQMKAGQPLNGISPLE
jgi:hypothetical protein